MEQRELERRNLLWAWGLFAFFVVCFGAAIGVAYLYLALAG